MTVYTSTDVTKPSYPLVILFIASTSMNRFILNIDKFFQSFVHSQNQQWFEFTFIKVKYLKCDTVIALLAFNRNGVSICFPRSRRTPLSKFQSYYILLCIQVN